ncbi:pentatricopeptide repeat-containing protein [Tripterygium wilfordii]|uniref:Pentatricopeptide repeat-containing protein n=1 Tax=Tripterygium wilfordii TaxID=458696 RepID=A0A7J7DM94_TRIWF|nr:pentatricopeptide repeat-containing protein [Tripterygium wilfordii]
MGCVVDAKQLFDEMPKKDLVSWNSLISGLLKNGCVDNCFDVFHRMKNEMGLPLNEVTFLPMISACTEMGAIDEGKYIHCFVLKLGMLTEVKVVNSLVNLYGKCGYVDAACRLFEGMPVQNLVSWNSMIGIHSQNGLSLEGMEMFNELRRCSYKPDQATIISVYQACEDLGIGKLAEAIHCLILRCGLFMNTIVATGLLNLYAKLGRLYASQNVFNEMFSPDKVI